MRRLATSALLIALLATGLAACDDKPGRLSGDPGPTGEKALKRARDVGNDPRATAEEIISAGGAVAVVVAGKRRLVAYNARDFDYEEGDSRSAWALYDDDGDRLAEGLVRGGGLGGPPLIFGVANGFIIDAGKKTRWAHLSKDGRTTDVPSSTDPVPSRPGDVLLGIVAVRRPTVYRPGPDGGPGQVLRLNRIPGSDYRVYAGLGADGSVWQLVQRRDLSASENARLPKGFLVSRSADGRAPWTYEKVPTPTGFSPTPRLEVIGDRLFVLGIDRTKVGHKVTATYTLLERSTAPAGTWKVISLAGLAFRSSYPTINTLPDGHVVLGSERVYVQDGDQFREASIRGKFRRNLQVAGDDLYWFAGATSNVAVSHDQGRTWKYLQR